MDFHIPFPQKENYQYFWVGKKSLLKTLRGLPDLDLTLKVPITTAADVILKFFFFFIFQRKQVDSCESVDDSHEVYRGYSNVNNLLIHMKYIEDIQMFGVNMTFISSSEVKKCIFHECQRHE